MVVVTLTTTMKIHDEVQKRCSLKLLFSNSLIIHQDKTKKITTMKEVQRNTSNFIKNTPLHVVFSTLFSVFGYPDEILSLVFDKLLFHIICLSFLTGCPYLSHPCVFLANLKVFLILCRLSIAERGICIITVVPNFQSGR